MQKARYPGSQNVRPTTLHSSLRKENGEPWYSINRNKVEKRLYTYINHINGLFETRGAYKPISVAWTWRPMLEALENKRVLDAMVYALEEEYGVHPESAAAKVRDDDTPDEAAPHVRAKDTTEVKTEVERKVDEAREQKIDVSGMSNEAEEEQTIVTSTSVPISACTDCATAVDSTSDKTLHESAPRKREPIELLKEVVMRHKPRAIADQDGRLYNHVERMYSYATVLDKPELKDMSTNRLRDTMMDDYFQMLRIQDMWIHLNDSVLLYTYVQWRKRYPEKAAGLPDFPESFCYGDLPIAFFDIMRWNIGNISLGTVRWSGRADVFDVKTGEYFAKKISRSDGHIAENPESTHDGGLADFNSDSANPEVTSVASENEGVVVSAHHSSEISVEDGPSVDDGDNEFSDCGKMTRTKDVILREHGTMLERWAIYCFRAVCALPIVPTTFTGMENIDPRAILRKYVDSLHRTCMLMTLPTAYAGDVDIAKEDLHYLAEFIHAYNAAFVDPHSPPPTPSFKEYVDCVVAFLKQELIYKVNGVRIKPRRPFPLHPCTLTLVVGASREWQVDLVITVEQKQLNIEVGEIISVNAMPTNSH